MELAYFLEVIKRRWWVVAASVLLCTGSAYLLLSRTPTWYQATTTVRILFYSPNPNDPSIDPHQVARRYQNLIREPAILEGAAQTVSLPYVPSPENVSARLVADSLLLEITVRDTDPEHARALADAIAQQLVLQEDEARRAFVQDELQRLEELTRQTEDEIREEQVRLAAADSARAIQQHQGEIAALQEKLAQHQSVYASLLQRWVNLPTTVTIEQSATTPARPIRSPSVPETLLLTAALGLILGLVGAFFMEFRAGGRARDRESTAAGGGS
jgi:uncharacterized protein involved in exopolysaccharide biosynthesis